MAYSKQTWVRGEKVASTKLNHMEDGIATISANGAIDTAKLADGAVTAPKLADSAYHNTAVTFDITNTYSVGDYVIYSGALYRFKEDKAAGAWDSTKVVAAVLGDDVSDLKSAMKQDYAYTIDIEQGYWAIADGTPALSATWCRTNKFVDKDFIISTSTIPMWLLAFEKTSGQYVGTWNGTQFNTSFENTNFKKFDISEFVANYPNYVFAIDFRGSNDITPTTVYADITVESAIQKDLRELSGTLNDLLINDFNIEQGYYSVVNGEKANSTTWCRSNYITHIYDLKATGNLKFILVAFNADGTYVGAWNGSQFVASDLTTSMYQTVLIFSTIMTQYPEYRFAINFYNNGEVLTPTSARQMFNSTNASIPSQVSLDIRETCTRILFPVKQGEVFIMTSLTSSVLPVAGKLELYDDEGNYLNYYGLGGEQSRTVTSALNFTYISVSGVQNVEMNIKKDESFGSKLFKEGMVAVGENNKNISTIKNKTYVYRHELSQSKAFILKYGYAPVNCDARFLWITDLHGESSRMEHCADVVKTFGTGIIPFVLNTGDTVEDVMGDGIGWYNNIIGSMDVPVLNMVGNHDTYITNGVPTDNKQDVYNEIIAPFVSDWNVTQPTNAASNGYCYYYKDISTIRLIVLDSMYWDATQKTWLESVLSDSLSNYKNVIIACHSPFNSELCTMVDTPWNTGWLSRDSTIMNSEALACVKTYIDNGGTFIAWLQGHVHGDEIVTLYDGRQLAICNNSFSNRGTKVPKTNTQDDYNYNSYTLVAVDADNKLLKLMRIGADISITGKKHDGFVWNFVNNTVVDSW